MISYFMKNKEIGKSAIISVDDKGFSCKIFEADGMVSYERDAKNKNKNEVASGVEQAIGTLHMGGYILEQVRGKEE